MSISEHFRYRNDVFQSDIFVSDIGITDVDVGCRISPTLRLMSMPTYGEDPSLPRGEGGGAPSSTRTPRPINQAGRGGLNMISKINEYWSDFFIQCMHCYERENNCVIHYPFCYDLKEVPTRSDKQVPFNIIGAITIKSDNGSLVPRGRTI
jgi:hypothetical protein